MARGKHLSLEEAHRAKMLDRFAKEHPSEGDEGAFDRHLGQDGQVAINRRSNLCAPGSLRHLYAHPAELCGN
jgi:hypothetical protein